MNRNVFLRLGGCVAFALFFAGVLWMLNPLTVSEKVDPETNPTSTPPPAIPLVDFKLLEKTQPDDNYHPVYPEALSRLDGTHIRIRGFMAPFDDLEDMSRFMLMGYPTGCNFCAPPSVNQVVLARQPDRLRPFPYIGGPIEITGRLSLWKTTSDDPAHRDEYFLYILEDVRVEKVEPTGFRTQGHR